MAHVLGFTGVDDEGQEGIELSHQSALMGKAGSRRVIKDRLGHIVEDVESIKSPQEGRDVSLAIDSKIQYLAYKQLKAAVELHKAKAGGIVVIDSQTGKSWRSPACLRSTRTTGSGSRATRCATG